MGKKRARKTKTSKGERRSIVAGVKEARADRSAWDKSMDILAAWKKGQNPWVTVPGPGSNQLMIRVKSNKVWGDPKKIAQGIYAKVAGDE